MPKMLKVLSIRSKGKLRQVVFSGNLELLLDKDACIKYNLVRGNEIPTGNIPSIKAESIRNQAERYVSYLLARQEYSSGLLRNKLMARGYEPKLVGNIISRLKKSGHIDDERYAHRKAESILNRKPAGHSYLVAYLRAKFIPKLLAEKVVTEILSEFSEEEMALKLLKDRWWYFSKFGIETARRKAYNYLSRRSIGYQAARSAFEKISKEAYDN